MSIREDNRGYRRGVVLGFTVAEVILLLLFCLLLLLAPAALVTQPPPAPAIVVEAPDAPRTDPPPPVPKPRAAEDQPSPRPPRKPPISDDQRKSWSQVPPDWNVIEQSGEPHVPVSTICAAIGVKDCKPADLRPKENANDGHNWPPIIRLREADGEFFVLGRADVNTSFERAILRDAVPKIVEIARQFKVDVIEVVGHTDEQPIQARNSNLDTVAIEVLAQGAPASKLIAADNAGLGLARAIAIVQVLKRDERLRSFNIIPVSAAQLVDVSGKLSDGSNQGDVKERRRIDIRVRRSDEVAPALDRR